MLPMMMHPHHRFDMPDGRRNSGIDSIASLSIVRLTAVVDGTDWKIAIRGMLDIFCRVNQNISDYDLT